MSKIYTAADQLIGHTPLLELTHIEKEQELPAHIIAKLEYFNPAGSVKDRIAKKMIDDAEEKGLPCAAVSLLLQGLLLPGIFHCCFRIFLH